MAQYTTEGSPDLARTYDVARSKLSPKLSRSPRRHAGETDAEWSERVRSWEEASIVGRALREE